MNILGLHSGHDGSACIVKDGRLVVAIGAERLTGDKKHWGLCEEIVDYCLDAAGLALKDIDIIGLSDYHHKFLKGVIEVTENGEPVEHYWQNVTDNDVRYPLVKIRGHSIPGVHIGHQLGHCASAYYTSPFTEAYCFSMDASGGLPQCNSLVAHGKGNKLTALYCPRLMVGCAYGFTCERLGIGSQILKAGSMMGLAAYGTPSPYEQYIDGVFVIPGNGGWSQILEHVDRMWLELSGGTANFAAEDSDKQRSMDIAATLQCIFEEAILRCVGGMPTGENLCLSGGSMLNCNANSAIRRQGKYKRIHHFPACSDDGLCVGTALYIAHNLQDAPRYDYTSDDIAFLGAERKVVPIDVARIAKALADGKLVAWCNGKSEYGPRALGHRSLLADPRGPDTRNYINSKIKKREWYRPFAPSVLAEDAWCEPSPFMLYTEPVKDSNIPAVTHVDGTARPQTVEPGSEYYDLIKVFKDLTGVPMLLNTSLNGPGQPLIETDEQALKFWQDVPVDMLVLHGKIYTR